MTTATQSAASRRPLVDADTERRLQRFLFDEAELIDNMEWDDWLTCLHPEICYWAPVRENRVYRERKHEFYPKGTSVYFEESWEFLRQRVFRLQTQTAWAEEPASRSRHLITNIRVDARDDGDFDVRSNFFIYRSRGERSQDHIAGERRDIIRRDDSAPFDFLILEREIRFDMATILVKNLSLFY
ncbi:Biphenyl dioxygenase subunit beta [Corynebacterium ciconiae DSM 44920]|uniref:aromatic-ring-hydroxylating dioxygenase subunit beta n=1 Tax=Corynebacterium ciconiae TaxID=227319 RepID=UPI00037456AA|nr:aromatic-ring-hydroxylating dioxygenase subunit beta [Corynebacterium ciconiae]WKD60518.1 Biphenyl dioxygenase subunit beta [Corynebacterium ciconiae DSM 44920]